MSGIFKNWHGYSSRQPKHGIVRELNPRVVGRAAGHDPLSPAVHLCLEFVGRPVTGALGKAPDLVGDPRFLPRNKLPIFNLSVLTGRRLILLRIRLTLIAPA